MRSRICFFWRVRIFGLPDSNFIWSRKFRWLGEDSFLYVIGNATILQEFTSCASCYNKCGSNCYPVGFTFPSVDSRDFPCVLYLSVPTQVARVIPDRQYNIKIVFIARNHNRSSKDVSETYKIYFRVYNFSVD